MRTYGTCIAMTLLLAGSLTGCSHLPFHKTQQAQAPPLQTGQGQLEEEEKKAQAPPPSNLPQPSAQTTPPELPPAKPRKVKHPKKKKHADSNSSSTPVQQASVAPPASPSAEPSAAASPIGQLTTGDDATGAQTKHDTAALIQQTEYALAKINRPLSADEQITAAQIRTFLKQAKQALDVGDSDGAQNLATKAKLLLGELTKD